MSLPDFHGPRRNFESKLFRAVSELIKVHKARITLYRSSANGQSETYNRTLIDAVLCYVDKAQNCWDEHLTQIAGALRSAVNRNSGFTAKKLMPGRGRGVNTPVDLLYPAPRRGTPWTLGPIKLTLRWRCRPPMNRLGGVSALPMSGLNRIMT